MFKVIFIKVYLDLVVICVLNLDIFLSQLFIAPMAMYSVHLSLTAKTEEQAWVAKLNGM